MGVVSGTTMSKRTPGPVCATGTKPLLNPPPLARGWHGSSKDDCTTEWLAERKLNCTMVPGGSVMLFGVYVRPLRPTSTCAMRSPPTGSPSEGDVLADAPDAFDLKASSVLSPDVGLLRVSMPRCRRITGSLLGIRSRHSHVDCGDHTALAVITLCTVNPDGFGAVDSNDPCCSRLF